MTIYLATNSDGKHTEGIGAMVQYQMACYAAAKMHNLNYAFFGFKNLTHYQYFDITQQKFCDDINHFFSFPNQFNKSKDYEIHQFDELNSEFFEFLKSQNQEENSLCFVSPTWLMNFMQSNLKSIEDNKLFKNLKNYIQKPKDVENRKKLKVLIHVRKLTKTDCDPNPIRDLYDNTKQNRLIKLIKIFLKIVDCEVHIHSQGKDVLEIKNYISDKEAVFFHLDEYPTKTLWDMIGSDILVAANSSLSYIAHLYGNQITLIRDNFYHKMYEDTIFLDSNYEFDKLKLKLLVDKKFCK
jgi:hypothetical protein